MKRTILLACSTCALIVREYAGMEEEGTRLLRKGILMKLLSCATSFSILIVDQSASSMPVSQLNVCTILTNVLFLHTNLQKVQLLFSHNLNLIHLDILLIVRFPSRENL